MRSINQIQADISKLQAELADVNELDSMNREAVHILKNLGWTRQKGQWIKPRPSVGESRIRDYQAPKYAHGFVRSDVVSRKGYFGRWLVRSVVSGTHVEISEILNTHSDGARKQVSTTRYSVDVQTLNKAIR